jgi:hypothetical protein
MGASATIVEICFFTRSEAERFIDGYAEVLDKEGVIAQHRAAYEKQRGELLSKLQKDTKHATGSVKFDGYAPVLLAVAKVLSDVSNFGASVVEHNKNAGWLVESIPHEILVREQTKMESALQDQLPKMGVDPHLLYTPNEQRARLLAKLIPDASLGPNVKPEFPTSQAHEQYENKVEEFIEQHPFLDGLGQSVGNAVFEADLWAAGIFGDIIDCKSAVIATVQDPRRKPNPFLLSMIESRLSTQQLTDQTVDAECIGPIYDSLCARVATGEDVLLYCHPVVHVYDENRFGTRCTLLVVGSQLTPIYIFRAIVPVEGVLDFPRGLGRCVIYCDNDLEIGDGENIRLNSPSLLDANRITYKGTTLSIDSSLKARQTGDSNEGALNETVIIAKEVDAVSVTRAPKLATGVRLTVSWPNSDQFPWHQYSKSISKAPQDLEDARLALRRLVLTFRSHSKGALARYVDKVEHFRMTRGEIGEKLREQLIQDGILSRKGAFYFLDPDKLGEIVGTTYQDIKAMRFSSKCDEYLRGVKSK